MSAYYTVEDRGYTSPCWMWQKHRTQAGYGATHDANKKRCYAHRLYYADRYGPIPKGLELDHLCRNRACVNPEHLEAVTHAENVGRGAQAKLTPDQVREIRASPLGCVRLARAYGVSKTAILHVRSGYTWKHVV